MSSRISHVARFQDRAFHGGAVRPRDSWLRGSEILGLPMSGLSGGSPSDDDDDDDGLLQPSSSDLDTT